MKNVIRSNGQHLRLFHKNAKERNFVKSEYHNLVSFTQQSKQRILSKTEKKHLYQQAKLLAKYQD